MSDASALPLPATTEPERAVIHVRVGGIVKRFGVFAALDGVSLDIAEGELVCFLGPSGCGKTTLLRVIAGLDRQDEGTIEIAGRDVSNAPPSARDFGIVFQSYALFPNLSVADNVGYGLVSRRWPRVEITARVDELLALVGLADQHAKYPAQLSGGQQQRVALARALASRPSLLLLDEPLSALDARVRLRLRAEIKDLQRRLGVTTILVTHDQEEALSMSDRIVVMNQGRIEQVGTPHEIYTKPATAFVADFVGAMNLIDGVGRSDGRVNCGGLSFKCAAPAPVEPLRVGFRPEAMLVGADAMASENRFKARVENVDFLGACVRVTLVPDRAPELRLHGDITRDGDRMHVLAPGSTIDIAIPPAALLVFPKRGAEQP